jgi:hypothetical protein
MKDLLSRIERSHTIVEQKLIEASPGAMWRVRSSRKQDHFYRVTASHCDCLDRYSPCKHMWAGPGRKAALVISVLAVIENREVLLFLATHLNRMLEGSPMRFQEIAQSVYRMQFDRLSDAKPQKRAA